MHTAYSWWLLLSNIHSDPANAVGRASVAGVFIPTIGSFSGDSQKQKNMFSTKFKNFLYTGLIVSFSLFVGGITIGYFVEKHNQIENLQTRVKCLEKEVSRINNECTHMREMDTLILNMSEYHGKNIEVIEENYNVLSTRVRKTEEDLDYLYVYD